MRLDTRIDDRGTFVAVTIDDGTVFTVDVEDVALVDGYRWFRLNKNHRTPSSQYIARTANGRNLLVHRAITDAPKGLTVDHIDGNILNNRRHNLRLCTQAENSSKRHFYKKGVSGRRGVYPTTSGRFAAIISTGNKRRYIGTFDDLDEAARAWDNVARQLRGDFTLTNFVA